MLTPCRSRTCRVRSSASRQCLACVRRSTGWGGTSATTRSDRVQLDHSGAFPAGASTNVMLMEGEQLGIVTLTNSQTRGVPEGINSAFFDIATHGEQTVDWLGAYGKIFADMDGNSPGEKWAATPAVAAVPLPLDAYVGTYDNSYYGPLTVSADGGGLSMSMGPPDHADHVRAQPVRRGRIHV